MKIFLFKISKKFAKKFINLFNRSYLNLKEIFFSLPLLEKPFPCKPFGDKPNTTRENYLILHKNAISKKYKKVDLFEKELNHCIDKKWFNDLCLYTQTCIKNSPLNFSHGRILYTLICKYIEDNIKPESKKITILETGTARGFSSLCFSKAINDKNIQGKVITIDCIPHNKKIFWNCISDFEGEKTREELLSKWEEELNNIIFIQGWTIDTLNKIGLNRIHFAFLDAQHTKKSVLEEFKFIYKRQISGDIIFFDDVTPNMFPGVCEAVDYIKINYPYKIKSLNFDRSRGYAIATRI
tara:strand:- start:4809 stop:5696 length:888 start_codon:yes stop_codon:yes gene_type:complete